jgi:hypothetical protein
MTTLEAPPLAGGPWLRSAELVGVSYPDRLIELVVLPYEREIDVPHPFKRDGPSCTEIITRGAFDGIERRANRIRANRDHDEARTFGRAATLHPGARSASPPASASPAPPSATRPSPSPTTAAWTPPPRFCRWATPACAGTPAPATASTRGSCITSRWSPTAPTARTPACSPSASTPPPPAVGERPATPVLARLELQIALDEEARINARWRG